MATLTFQTLQFREQKEGLKCIFHGSYSFVLPQEELEKIGKYTVTANSITFPAVTDKKLQHKFSILLEKGFAELTGIYTKKKTVYIHQNSGIPLLGTRFIGIQDRGTNFLEIKPITGCTMGCVFCSVDEGIGSKKSFDFFVEREYLVAETKKLLDFKKCPNIHVYINVHGEPLLYPELVELVADLRTIHWIKDITIITTAVLLTEEKIYALAAAGLSELNVSISAMDVESAKSIMGAKAYNIAQVKKIVAYAATKLKVTIAPVWVAGMNDAELEKIIAFGNEISCPVRIQKFCYNQFGRNPSEEMEWEEFFTTIKELEKKTKTKLMEQKEIYKLEKTKEYPVPFKRKEIVDAKILFPGRYVHERLCVARERLISVPFCKKNEGTVKIRITHYSHNIIVGEVV